MPRWKGPQVWPRCRHGTPESRVRLLVVDDQSSTLHRGWGRHASKSQSSRLENIRGPDRKGAVGAWTLEGIEVCGSATLKGVGSEQSLLGVSFSRALMHSPYAMISRPIHKRNGVANASAASRHMKGICSRVMLVIRVKLATVSPLTYE